MIVGVAGAVTLALATAHTAPRPDPIEVGKASAIARWGQIPCEGDVTVKRAHLPGFQAGEAGYSTDGTRRWDCQVTIDVEQVRGAERCAVAKHEFGHLHGLDHSPDPRSVMHSPLSMIPKACVRVFGLPEGW